MLLVILISATVFTLVYVIFISRSISKPIQKLCGFADEIGRGNFKRNEYAFQDRELIDLNRRMNETARKLEISDEDQKTFFQNVSHELKTPLMSIKGYAEGIKYGIFSSEKEHENASDIIIAESDRLNDLVADLLYISKMDSSNQAKTENFVSADLGGIAEDCADKLRGVLISSKNAGSKEKKISIYHPKRGIYIKCDEESLIRAIMNITANCLRYSETVVNIDYYESGDNIILSIKDDGAGIDGHDLPNIFKRFYKGKGGKHGIGLSIAKAIAEQHGAQIHANNREKCSGAEFTIIFNKE
jgi:signal transduction histidine kinase